jgi:hypothetical protein
VGKAHLASLEPDFAHHARMKIRWGGMPSPEIDFKRTLTEKGRALTSLEKSYAQTIAMKAGDPGVCALYKLGLAYDNFANVMVNAPPPRRAPVEVQDMMRELVTQQANGPKSKAADAFASAVVKSRELAISNECTEKALQMLRETYKPDAFPQMNEVVAEIPGTKHAAVGADLLTGIQPIPVAKPVVQAPVMKAAEKDELGDLERELREAPPDRGEERTAPVKSSPGKQGDEPEDLL